MYLILPHEEAKQYNIQKGAELELKGTDGGVSFYRWPMERLNETESYIDVGNGEGLEAEYISMCVDEVELND